MKPFILFISQLLAVSSFSQTPAVDWHKFAGGGGVSGNGLLALSGSIGQADAQIANNGTLAIVGGFLSAASAPSASLISCLVSSVNPALPGSNVNFTVTLSPVSPASGMPLGSIQFQSNGVALGSPVLLNGLSASLALATLPHGSNLITAAYAGDDYFLPSAGSLGQVIDTPPVGGSHFLVTTLNTPLNLSASVVAGLDYDPESDPLNLMAVSGASANGGTVSLGNGTLVYTPPASYVGTDQFTYTVSDGLLGGTNTSTAKVTVLLGQATSVFNYVSTPVNHTVSLRGYGIPGHSYDILVSGDLHSWSVLTTVQAAANGVILYADSQANTSPRYYRFAVHSTN